MRKTTLCASSLLLLAVSVFCQDDDLPFRRTDYYTWQEFRETVPAKCDTVILPVGTQEAHGVMANGTDALIPEALAARIAARVNALVAPTVPYGRTTSLLAYAGSTTISYDTFRAYCLELVEGLADCGFRNIVIFNGHGPNRAPLDEVAAAVSVKCRVRVLVVDWWSYCAAVTKEVWGADEDGGHAGLNENAALQAVYPQLIKPQRYNEEMAVVNDAAYTAYPNSGTILLYSKGRGYPDFDQEKAELYFSRVAEELAKLIEETRVRWDAEGIYR